MNKGIFIQGHGFVLANEVVRRVVDGEKSFIKDLSLTINSAVHAVDQSSGEVNPVLQCVAQKHFILCTLLNMRITEWKDSLRKELKEVVDAFTKAFNEKCVASI